MAEYHNSRLILPLVMASPSLLFRGCEEVTKEDMLDFARMYTKRYLRGAEYVIYKDGVGQVRGTLV